MNFGESIVEGSAGLATQITLRFRNNQNPFTVKLSPVDIDTADSMGVGSFINSMTIDETFRATAGCFPSEQRGFVFTAVNYLQVKISVIH